jgi:hypothetical protein
MQHAALRRGGSTARRGESGMQAHHGNFYLRFTQTRRTDCDCGPVQSRCYRGPQRQ